MTLRPNRSYSYGQMKFIWLLSAFSAAVLNIGLVAVAGPAAFMVPVFTAAGLGGLGMAFRHSARSAEEYQILAFTENGLEITHHMPGRRQTTHDVISNPQWARLEVERNGRDASQIVLSFQNKPNLIGHFLPFSELSQVESALRRALRARP